MSGISVVVPDWIDDPARVSGGNRYDRKLCDGLRAAGWRVAEIAAAGSWPVPDASALHGLAEFLDALPDGAVVLVDGLIASGARAVLVPRSGRLRLVVLVHMLFGGDAVAGADEAAVLTAAAAVVTTSEWTRRRLVHRYALPRGDVHVAPPGTDPAPVGSPSPHGGGLLCVGALTAVKGQDVLLDALIALAGLPWHCSLVGPLDREPAFVESLRHRAALTGVADRLRMPGPVPAASLEREYRAADLLVVPSRSETFGMVVTEALAAGLPVIATGVGGVPEALGSTTAGLPGLLVPPEDPSALAGALAGWLSHAGLRDRLRDAALRRREALRDWRSTCDVVAGVLTGVRAEPDRPRTRVAQ